MSDGQETLNLNTKVLHSLCTNLWITCVAPDQGAHADSARKMASAMR